MELDFPSKWILYWPWMGWKHRHRAVSSLPSGMAMWALRLLAFLMKWSLMKQAVNLIDTFKQLLCNWALSNKASAKLATKTKGKVPEQLQGQGLLDLGHQTGLSSQLLAPGMGPQSTWGLEVHQRPGKCMGNTKAYCGAWYLNCCCSRHCPG